MVKKVSFRDARGVFFTLILGTSVNELLSHDFFSIEEFKRKYIDKDGKYRTINLEQVDNSITFAAFLSNQDHKSVPFSQVLPANSAQTRLLEICEAYHMNGQTDRTPLQHKLLSNSQYHNASKEEQKDYLETLKMDKETAPDGFVYTFGNFLFKALPSDLMRKVKKLVNKINDFEKIYMQQMQPSSGINWNNINDPRQAALGYLLGFSPEYTLNHISCCGDSLYESGGIAYLVLDKQQARQLAISRKIGMTSYDLHFPELDQIDLIDFESIDDEIYMEGIQKVLRENGEHAKKVRLAGEEYYLIQNPDFKKRAEHNYLNRETNYQE